MVGYAALPLFMDPKTSAQPLSKNVRDYVLNAVRVWAGQSKLRAVGIGHMRSNIT